MHEKVALEHSSKSTKYELESSYGDLVHEHFSFLKTAKLPRECNEVKLDTSLPKKKKLGKYMKNTAKNTSKNHVKMPSKLHKNAVKFCKNTIDMM